MGISWEFHGNFVGIIFFGQNGLLTMVMDEQRIFFIKQSPKLPLTNHMTQQNCNYPESLFPYFVHCGGPGGGTRGFFGQFVALCLRDGNFIVKCRLGALQGRGRKMDFHGNYPETSMGIF